MISVIIPTCNRNDLLGKCLDQLNPLIQTVAAEFYEVIVTDDSKANNAKEFISSNYNWVTWLKGPGKGPAANRNNGASHAKSAWLVFVDDDCEPTRRFISEYINGITNYPDFKVFEGATDADREMKRFDEEAPVNLRGGLLFSCNFAILKAYFAQLQGFDENFPFPAMEDTELAYRIKQDKNDFFFLKNALVIHPWRKKKHIVKMTLKRFDAALYFIKKHPSEKHKFGFRYYMRAFAHQVINTAKYGKKFRFRGFGKKLVLDSMLIYCALYMLFKRD